MKENIVDIIGQSIRKNWDQTAMTHYGGESVLYADMGEKIANCI